MWTWKYCCIGFLKLLLRRTRTRDHCSISQAVSPLSSLELSAPCWSRASCLLFHSIIMRHCWGKLKISPKTKTGRVIQQKKYFTQINVGNYTISFEPECGVNVSWRLQLSTQRRLCVIHLVVVLQAVRDIYPPINMSPLHRNLLHDHPMYHASVNRTS